MALPRAHINIAESPYMDTLCGLYGAQRISVSFEQFRNLPLDTQCKTCKRVGQIDTCASPELMVSMDTLGIEASRLADACIESPHDKRGCYFEHPDYEAEGPHSLPAIYASWKSTLATISWNRGDRVIACGCCGKLDWTMMWGAGFTLAMDYLRMSGMVEIKHEHTVNRWLPVFAYEELPTTTDAQARFLQQAFRYHQRVLGAVPKGPEWRTAARLNQMVPKLLAAVRSGPDHTGPVEGYHATPLGRIVLDRYYEQRGIAKPSGLLWNPMKVPPESYDSGLEPDNGIKPHHQDTSYVDLQGRYRAGGWVDLPKMVETVANVLDIGGHEWLYED